MPRHLLSLRALGGWRSWERAKMSESGCLDSDPQPRRTIHWACDLHAASYFDSLGLYLPICRMEAKVILTRRLDVQLGLCRLRNTEILGTERRFSKRGFHTGRGSIAGNLGHRHRPGSAGHLRSQRSGARAGDLLQQALRVLRKRVKI